MLDFVPPTSLIAPCGIDCRLCRAYIRQKNHCPGCRWEGPDKSISCTNCKIKLNCEKLSAGEITFCFECASFPCPPIIHLDKRYRTRYLTSPIENLELVRSIGIDAFIESENEKWSCPSCGNLLCMHKPLCPSCGCAWRE